MAVWSVVNSSLVSDEGNRIDAEYYKPDSLNATNIIKSLNYKNISELVQDGYRVVYENTKILQKNRVNIDKDSRFLQATNISSDGLWIDINEIGFVHEIDWNRYPKGRIKHGEVLIEVKGEAEKVTIVQDYVPERTLVTGTLFKMTLNNIVSPEYLFAFMNSKYGKLLRNRTKVNTLIAYVSKPELYKIPVYIPSAVEHQNITTMIQSSFDLMKQSQTLYKEGEELLEKELGLDGLEFEKPRSYTAKLSEVYSHNRFDSEHFKPKYFQLKELIKNYTCGYESLTSHINYLKPNINPHSNPTQDYNYIELSGINASLGIVENSEKLKGRETPSRAKRVVQSGDLLVSSVVGSVEKVALVSDDEDGFLASTGFFHFQSDFYTSEYLLILMKSKIIKEQLFQESTGGILSAVPDSNLKNIIIPIVDESIRNEIALKVKKSHKALKQSKQLLEDAKAKVEALIEEATR